GLKSIFSNASSTRIVPHSEDRNAPVDENSTPAMEGTGSDRMIDNRLKLPLLYVFEAAQGRRPLAPVLAAFLLQTGLFGRGYIIERESPASNRHTLPIQLEHQLLRAAGNLSGGHLCAGGNTADVAPDSRARVC